MFLAYFVIASRSRGFQNMDFLDLLGVPYHASAVFFLFLFVQIHSSLLWTRLILGHNVNLHLFSVLLCYQMSEKGFSFGRRWYWVHDDREESFGFGLQTSIHLSSVLYISNYCKYTVKKGLWVVLWRYGLWRIQGRDKKLERFCPKHDHISRKKSYLEKCISMD